MKSPPPCPTTVTVRRNPIRKARATPSSAIPLSLPLKSPSKISSFPINDILAIDNTPITSPPAYTDNLKVYLRIRPLTVQTNAKKLVDSKNVWPKVKPVSSKLKVCRSNEVCVLVNDDKCSVTVSTPLVQQEVKRTKAEVYDGFSRVFPSESSQSEVYGEMVKPIVDDFMKGKCGMLAAMGPSGSGKTHTVFGSGREPGMVPLALRDIFRQNKRSGGEPSRMYYLSMMEIGSEKGKGEKFIDLLHDGGHVFMQQSVVKGTQEVVICDAQHAESLIARGMLKRATATTNSNSQSSRSQCIINIRSASQNCDGDDDGKGSTTLTIVDLAGAEKEKKTGNQGTRLLESNFINNTSMVFSLCLRSLLEHQKNRNKQLPKHYHNSLLTRYMRDYLEGKKRMALILTVKPGIEDYPDTTFLLRQASPFANIKFKNVEEPVNLNNSKRPSEALPRSKQLKRMKFGDNEASVVDEGAVSRDLSTKDCKKIAEVVIVDGVNNEIGDIKDENLTEVTVLSDEPAAFGTRTKLAEKRDHDTSKPEKDRQYQTLLGLSKAFWTALKQHKKELEVLKIENQHLRDGLSNEKARSSGLENELSSEKLRFLDLEIELKELRTHCENRETSINKIPGSVHDYTSNLSQHQITEQQEMCEEVLPYCLKASKPTATHDKNADHLVIDTSAVAYSTRVDIEDYQVNATTAVDSFSRYHDLSVSVDDDNDQDSSSYNIDAVECEVVITQSTSACISTSNDCEQVLKITGDSYLKELEQTATNDKNTDNSVIDTSAVVSCSTSVDEENYQTSAVDSFSIDHDISVCINDDNDQDSSSYNIDPVDCEVVTTQSTSACVSTSNDSEQVLKITGDDLKELEQTATNNKNTDNSVIDTTAVVSCSTSSVDSFSGDQDLSVRIVDDDDKEPSSLNIDIVDCEVAITQSAASACVSTSSVSEQGVKNMGDEKSLEVESSFNIDIVDCEVAITQSAASACVSTCSVSEQGVKNMEDEKSLEVESASVSNESSFNPIHLECGNITDSPEDEDLKHGRKLTRLQIKETGTEHQIASVAADSDDVLSSPVSLLKDDNCFMVGEEQNGHDNKEQLDPQIKNHASKGRDVKDVSSSVAKLPPHSNSVPVEKPKRRLLPASSVLLKDLSILDVKDENDRPKVGKGRKVVAVDDKNRTQGSLSLLHLLKNNISQ